jgi:hypothetical protein
MITPLAFTPIKSYDEGEARSGMELTDFMMAT